MRILLIYPNIEGPFGFNIGLSLMSTKLKEAGYEVSLIHVTKETNINKELKNKLDDGVLFVGITSNTLQAEDAIKIAKRAKNLKDIPIVIGGPHATFYPKEVLQNKYIDVVCVGEGDNVIVNLANTLKSGGDLLGVKNIWFKKSGRVFESPRSGFVKAADIPNMDIFIWDFNKIVKKRNGWLDIMAGRGCPFNCSFCFNHKARFLGEDAQNYVRMREPKVVVGELENIMKMVPEVKTISFVDDTFTINKAWLEKFSGLYKKRINKPYVINTTANLVDEETVKILKRSGCSMIRVGLETGSESTRRLILNKYINNSVYENAIKITRKHKITALTYNMIGLPNETAQDMLNTLKFNAKNKADVVRVSTFFPFKYTDIYTYCVKNGLIKSSKKPKSFDSGIAALKFSRKESVFILKLQRYFRLWLNYYIPENKVEYEKLVNKVSAATKKEILSEEFDKEVAKAEKLIISKISERKGSFYERRYADHFAFLT